MFLINYNIIIFHAVLYSSFHFVITLFYVLCRGIELRIQMKRGKKKFLNYSNYSLLDIRVQDTREFNFFFF